MRMNAVWQSLYVCDTKHFRATNIHRKFCTPALIHVLRAHEQAIVSFTDRYVPSDHIDRATVR